MRFDRIRFHFAVSLLVSAASGYSVSAFAASDNAYDGLWNVTIVTKTGSCEPTAHYPLTVTEGRITAPGSDVNGKVGREGTVKVSIGPAYANGQLSGNTGSGKWNGASGGVPCSGRWEASRQ